MTFELMNQIYVHATHPNPTYNLNPTLYNTLTFEAIDIKEKLD